jgi:putative flippase GtrA
MSEARAAREAGRLAQLLYDLMLYGMASALALAADTSMLLLLTMVAGVHYLAAGAAGFTVGLIIVYGISFSKIFKDRRMLPPQLEFAGFVTIGIAGLALNELLLFLFVSTAQMGILAAKVLASCVVFLFNFLSRRSLLFSASPAAQGELSTQQAFLKQE